MQRCDLIHNWFGLTYSSYLVLPRVLMQEMPDEWQEKMVALLNEAQEVWEHDDNYTVYLRDKNGKFKSDPLCRYKYPDWGAVNACRKPPPPKVEGGV